MGCLSAGGGFFNPFNLEIKQIANTNVLHWAGRTFALHEVRLDHDCREKHVIVHLHCLMCMPGPKTVVLSRVCLLCRVLKFSTLTAVTLTRVACAEGFTVGAGQLAADSWTDRSGRDRRGSGQAQLWLPLSDLH